MKYVSFVRPDGRPSFGRTDGMDVIDLGNKAAVPDLRAALAANVLHELDSGAAFKLSDLVVLPPIPRPGKILCVGLNYETHRKETGRVVTRLNGQTVQNQGVAEMIWSVPELIAYISTFTPLAAGDVIATGTPGGVGSKRVPPLWMRPGDTVCVDIEGVGLLVNPVIDETS
jgi:2-keto-4-pentenoate hydratase/2-oxohepta-3-ene-1,7-dioic acid hydratase in catechol pathway